MASQLKVSSSEMPRTVCPGTLLLTQFFSPCRVNKLRTKAFSPHFAESQLRAYMSPPSSPHSATLPPNTFQAQRLSFVPYWARLELFSFSFSILFHFFFFVTRLLVEFPEDNTPSHYFFSGEESRFPPVTVNAKSPPPCLPIPRLLRETRIDCFFFLFRIPKFLGRSTDGPNYLISFRRAFVPYFQLFPLRPPHGSDFQPSPPTQILSRLPNFPPHLREMVPFPSVPGSFSERSGGSPRDRTYHPSPTLSSAFNLPTVSHRPSDFCATPPTFSVCCFPTHCFRPSQQLSLPTRCRPPIHLCFCTSFPTPLQGPRIIGPNISIPSAGS